MKFFGGVISINDIYTLLFVVFGVLLVGYVLGRITIKGISLGDAGVFIIALQLFLLSYTEFPSATTIFSIFRQAENSLESIYVTLAGMNISVRRDNV